MKRFIVLLLTIAGIAVGLSSCQKAPELTLTGPASLEISADGGSNSITFTANRDWSVRSSDSWVSISPSSGTASDGTVTVSIRCNENTTYEDRSATITITMEELSQMVTVKQPANLGIVIPTKSYDLASDARSIEVEVQSNVQYTVSISDNWIKQTGTKGLTTNKLTFSIEENKTYDSREGKITIKPNEGNVQEQVISVKQAQKDALIVKDTSFDMPYGGGEIEVKVEANVSFDVKPSEDWIHYVETKALSGSTVRLKVDENPTYSAREGKIEIKQKNGTLSHTLTVKQAGRIAVTSIELNKKSLTLKEGESETLTATVKPNNATDKTVTWTSSDDTVATVDESGKVTAVKKGTATITAKAGEKSATCSVVVYRIDTPDAIDLGLSVKWASFNIGASAPEEYGEYYAWGETEPKEYYRWISYKFGTSFSGPFSKYNTSSSYGPIDNKTVLEPEDDVAHVKLGGKWRMPTDEEWTELRKKCTWTWTTNYNGTGVKGRIVTASNGNSIFLPAAGMRYETKRYGAGSEGYYWSSSLGGGRYAWRVNFNSGHGNDVVRVIEERYLGQSVRPVTE